ncbi:MAG: SMODS domain-containing nucleotidyltransferase [Candidatus Dormibacteraceae bacterium]
MSRTMALTVAQGFDTFLERLTPLESQRDAKAKHRDSVEASLRKALDVKMFRESGSFNHGTGVRNFCDVDLLVSLGTRPGSSTTALNWVKKALSDSFPKTTVTISRPAVRVLFNGGKETWEIIPGFRKNTGDAALYDIPGVMEAQWLESAPTEHINYVNEVNKRAGLSGAAKKLARLIKAWKYYNNVPVSSFYLEMRAAQYMATETYWDPIQDLSRFVNQLQNNKLGAMNDPMGLTSRFYACSTDAKAKDAVSRLNTAATRAEKALIAHRGDKPGDAFYWLGLLFGGNFPVR